MLGVLCYVGNTKSKGSADEIIYLTVNLGLVTPNMPRMPLFLVALMYTYSFLSFPFLSLFAAKYNLEGKKKKKKKKKKLR